MVLIHSQGLGLKNFYQLPWNYKVPITGTDVVTTDTVPFDNTGYAYYEKIC